MKAIILAAGRGSRLNNITDEKPKCLVNILGKPILEWQIEALNRSDVEDITVICGYRKDQISGNFITLENPRWNRTNMVSTLACASGVLRNDTCIVSYADIICRSSHIVALKNSPGDIAITYDTKWKNLWQLRFEDPMDDAETFLSKNGRLKEIGGTPSSLDDVHGQYMGLLKITPQGWLLIENYLNEIGPESTDQLDMTSLLSALLDRKVTITTVPVDGGWVEVDNPEDLDAYVKQLSAAQNWTHDWRNL